MGEDSDAAAKSANDLAAAEANLRAVISQRASGQAVVEGLSGLQAETEEMREQARLRAMSAEDREKIRISKLKEARETQLINDLYASGVEITDEMMDNIFETVDAYGEAAIAASKILNPVAAAASGTRKIADEAESARDAYVLMLNEMIAASPALQQLGFDADNLERTMAMVESRMEDAFMGMIDCTMSAKDAFKSMAADIIKELFRVLVVQRLVGSFEAGGGGILGAAFGAFGAAAHGGTVQSGSPTVVGEHGRELFVPQQNGRIMTTAQTKQMQGGGGSGVTIVQNINVSTGVQQTVRTEIKQLMPQIAESAKSAVADAKLRGGSYGRSFA